MMGTIGLKGLRIACVIGVHAEERRIQQELLCDLELDIDFAAASQSDDVGDTLDYDLLADAITKLATEGEFRLIETYAEQAAALLIEDFAVSRARVTVRKPNAVAQADHAWVSVERHGTPPTCS